MTRVGYPPSFPPTRISLLTVPHREPPVVLSKNEIVEGRVLRTFSSDTALLTIKGKRVIARTAVRLSEGGLLSLKVQEPRPVPTLKLLGIQTTGSRAVNTALILAALKENLWKSTAENVRCSGLSRETIYKFEQVVDDLSLRFFSKPTPELLRVLIDISGLRWEAKLRAALGDRGARRDHLTELLEGDLKGLASRILALKGEEVPFLKRLISTLSNTQILNRLGLDQGGRIFLPLPIQLPGGLFTVAQLLIELPQREDEDAKTKDGEDFSRITFLLELSSLGPLRADVTVQERMIDGRFLLTTREAKARVEEGIPILIGGLEEKGFTVRSMECYLKDPLIITQPLIREMISDDGCTVNLVV